MKKYTVGVARKTNSQVRTWVADGETGYTSTKANATVYPTLDEAKAVARRETKGNWKGIVCDA